MTALLAPDEEERLTTLASLNVLDTGPEAAFDGVVEIVRALLDVPIATVTLIDRDRQWFKARAGLDLCEAPRNIALCDHAIREKSPLVVADAREDARFARNPLVTGAPGVRFYTGAPIIVDGHAVGTVCGVDTRPRQIEAQAVAALAALADQVAALLLARRQEAQHAERERQLVAFLDHSPALTFLKDAQGRKRLASRRHRELYGEEADAEMAPEVLAAARANDATVRQTGKPLMVDESRPLPDGTPRVWQVLKFPLAVGDETWVGGVALDVTAQREAERTVRRQGEELAQRNAELVARDALLSSVLAETEAAKARHEQAEARFAAFLEHAPVAAFLKGADGTFRFVNRRLAATFDRETSDVLGLRDDDLFDAEDATRFREADAFVCQTGETLDVEEDVPTGWGTVERWRTLKFPVRIGGETWVGGVGMDVTALREAEARIRDQNAEVLLREEALMLALQDAETSQMAAQMAAARFEQLFDGLPVACFTYGEGGTIHEWNAAATHLWGLSAEEALLTQVVGTAVSEANREGQAELDGRVFAGETVRGVERRETMRDGRERWLLTSTFPLRTPSGTIVGAVCASLDVTKRKRAEEEMREAKQFAEGMADSATSMLYLVDFDTKRQVWSNRDWAATLGYSEEEFLTADFLDRIMHPEDLADLPGISEALARAQDREMVEFEARFRHVDGDWRWLWFRETVYRRNADGTPAQIMGSAQDVTARKRMEADLRASEARFRTVVESLHEGLTVQDENGRILLWNPSAQRIIGADITGANAMDGLGTTWRLVREDGTPYDPEAMPIPCALRTGEPQESVVVGIETTAGTQWLSVNAAPLASGGGGEMRAAVSSFVDITERKRMEEELRSKEELLRTVLGSLREGLVVHDRTGEVVLWNESAERILGVAGEALSLDNEIDPRNKSISESGEAIDRPDRPVMRALLTGEANEGTVMGIVQAGGNRRWLSVSAAPIRTNLGEVGSAVTTLVDITERKRMEAELRASEARFRTVLNALHEGVVVQDADGRVSLWNRSAERMLGIRGEEMDLRRTEDPRSTGFREDGTEFPIAERPVAQALREGKPCDATIGMRLPNGETRWNSVMAVPLVPEDGGPAEWAVASFMDVTERKRMETALRENEARFRTVVESLSEGLVVQDEARRIVYWNRSAEQILGMTADQMRGLTELPKSYRLVDEDDGDLAFEDRPSARALRTGQAQAAMTMGVHMPDGGFRWISVGSVPFDSEDGTRAAVSSIVDITEQYEQERRLRKYAEDLKAANGRLEGLATTDGLTGLKNHRFFQDWLRRRIDQCAGGLSLSIALLDVDRFKTYNDDFGHQAGDAVLRGVASALQSALREGDLVARYGGEEFVVVMPGADAEGALASAERLREAVAALPFPDRAVTASFGVATLGEGLVDAPSIIRAADEALYGSKRSGRNRVTHCREIGAALEAA